MGHHGFFEFFSLSTDEIGRGSLVFQKCSGMETKLWLGGWYHVFSSKTYFLSVPKKFVRGPWCLRPSGMEKKLLIRGRVSRFSDESFLSHSAGKKLGGTLLYSNEILVKRTFMQRRGVVTFFSDVFDKLYRKIF